MARPKKPVAVDLIWDWKLRAYRPRKTGWKHPNPTVHLPRDSRGRFLPHDDLSPPVSRRSSQGCEG